MISSELYFFGRLTERTKMLIWIGVVTFFICLVSFPVYMLIKYSLHTSVVTYGRPLPLWPTDPTLANYTNLVLDKGLWQVMGNSLFIALTTVLLTLLMGLPAGYVLSRYNFPFKRLLFILIVSLRLFPDISSVIPVVTFFIRFNMHSTFTSVILSHTLLALPYVIYIASFAFDFVPKDVEEQARVLGAGRATIFFKILLPMILPSVITSSIYTFLLSWDEFIFAHFLLGTGGTSLKTLTVYLDEAVTGSHKVQEHVQSAISVVISLPVIIFTYIVQRHMVSGGTVGAVK